MIIDTHYHASLEWWEPVEVFLFNMDRAGVDKGVLIAAMGAYDNSYLLECVTRFPDRLKAIGLVDPGDPAAPERMSELMDRGLAGFRFTLIDERTLADRALWQRAAELDAVVSVVGTTQQLASHAFAEVVRAFPQLRVVLEHGGVVGHLQTGGHGGENQLPQPPYTDYRKVLGLADIGRVYVKVPGFGEMMARPKVFAGAAFDVEQAPPYIDMCIDAFGADRMMVGSDPSSSVREGYVNVWRYLGQYLDRFGPERKTAVLGRTAQSLFGFDAG
jgi:L-fuconolactonase